jgi:hypothetical protein
MKHTTTVQPGDLIRVAAAPDETTSENGVAEVLGGVALAAAGSGGKSIRLLGRQARRHPKVSGIVLAMAVSAVLGWQWCRRRAAPAETRVALLDAA